MQAIILPNNPIFSTGIYLQWNTTQPWKKKEKKSWDYIDGVPEDIMQSKIS